MKSSVGKGAIILILSGLVCKFFGALFRLPLTNIIKIEGIGIFQMVMSLYSLSIVLVSSGLNSGLSKLISSARARGDYSSTKRYFYLALKFGLLLSISLGLIFLVFSSQISSLQGNSNTKVIYMLFIFLLPLGSVIGIFRGIMQGYENMTPTAISQIIEQVAKFAFGLIFAYLFSKNGLWQGVMGAFLGIAVSEILAFIYLYFIISKNRIFEKNLNENISSNNFYKAVLPLTFSSAIYPLSQAVEGLIIISLLSLAGFSNEVATSLYGIQTGVVGAILNFPLIISLSVAVALLPKLSYLSSQNNIDAERKVIANLFSVMWFLLVPLVFGIASIAQNLYPMLYPSAMKNYLNIAVQLTFLSGIGILLTAIMQFLLSLLQAKGYFMHTLLFNTIGCCAKLGIVIIFSRLPQMNIFALPISSIVYSSIVCICSLIKLGRIVKISFIEFTLPILSSIVMFLTLKILQFSLNGFLAIIISVISGAFIYFICSLPLVLQYYKVLINKIKQRKQ